MRNYYLWGWHGQLNAGDDAFAITTAWGLRQYGNARKIIMDTDISDVLSKTFDIDIAHNQKIKFPGFSRLKRNYYRSISNSFVLAGGNTLESEDSLRSLISDRLWQQHNRNVFALGISVGPFKSVQHENLTKQYLNLMSFAGFRDDYSYEWACANNIQVPTSQAFDLAVLLPKATNQYSCIANDGQDEVVLGISLLPPTLSKAPDLEFADQLAKLTYEISKDRNLRIILFSLCRNPYKNDDIMCQAFYNSFPAQEIVHIYQHNGDASQTLVAMKRCSHFISMRLHGAIFSYINETPFFSLSYHPKCRAFIKTIGSDESLLMRLEKFDPDEYISKVELLLNQKDLVANMSLQNAQARALLNFEGLVDSINL